MPRARSGVGAAVVFQIEMRGFAFAVAFFLGFIALGFFQGVLHFGVWAQFFGAVPFGDGQIHFVLRRSRPSR